MNVNGDLQATFPTKQEEEKNISQKWLQYKMIKRLGENFKN